MDRLDKLLKEVENEWLGVLYASCKKEFEKVWLPSHDHIHHLRVWQNAKDLIRLLENNGIELSRDELEQLIVIVFFHDVGMTKTISWKHGWVSRKMCKLFFKKNSSLRIKNFETVLEVIEKHDDKEYSDQVQKLEDFLG